MYPYFYPSYFSPTKMGPAGMGPSGMGPGSMGPGSMGPGGMGNAGMGAAMPDMTDMTGMPPVTGSTAGPPVEPVTPAPPTVHAPTDFDMEPGSPVTTDIGYTQAYLKTQIGKKAKVEFLVGTNMLTDRIGTIVGVGVSYILLRLVESDDIMMGDIYSIKFVTFLE